MGIRTEAGRIPAPRDKVRLYSRRGNDFTERFAKIVRSVSKIKATSFVLDGEAVVVDEHGKPSFQMLQNRARLPAGWSLVYYAFDLLHYNGTDLKARPLRERRALLGKLLANSGVLLSQSLPGTLSEIVQAVRAHGLEGVIAKRLDSKYLPARRGDDWRFEGTKLLFAGKVHQGLNPANRRALLKLLQPLATKKCAFANLPTSKSGHWGEGVTAEEMGDYIWLRPEIGAEIKFAEWTEGGVLRHAEFVAVREM